ncbi:hypothetical protein OKW21_006422 [Catalinimonas alkaloidigena]|uniref:hypothetical protein n=1 Tax=Catalinimonas alkaloidigena TaxID=1075417 RepID=UPI002406840A|nr:hypothetical protein [Catalinimonas alkaloidigena]MDF9801159.1 hypothetical protein [Catalinimonas alkaloidigena]
MRRKRFPLSLLLAIMSMVLILALFLIFMPVVPATQDNTVKISAKVQAIEEGGRLDVIIRLAEDNHYYYINRGLEQGLKLEKLQKGLEGEQITLRYIKHWSLLNPSGRVRPVAQLSFKETKLFDIVSNAK